MNERRLNLESYSLRAVALRQLPSGSGRRDVERASVDDRCIKSNLKSKLSKKRQKKVNVVYSYEFLLFTDPSSEAED